LSLVGLALSFALGETLIPPYANRALAASSRRESKGGFVAAGLFSIAWFMMIALLGVSATQILPSGTPEDSVFVEVAIAVLPSGLLGLTVVAIAAIVMSSQESVLNAAAVSLTRDLIAPFRKIAEVSALRIAKLATVVLGAASIGLALWAPSIISGLLICYAIWGSSVLPPLVWGVLGKRTDPLVGLFALACGAVAATATLLGVEGSGDSGLALVVGLVGATAGVPVALVVNRAKEAFR
jgi:SSS family solute:Na+ symporter